MQPSPVLGVTRPSFLVLAPVCALLGLATAAAAPGPVDVLAAVLALLGALGAHVAVNALNEVEDFRSGLDFRTHRTPFSGGSGTLVSHPALAGQARLVALGAMAVTVGVGLALAVRAGWGLLPLGLAGLALIWLYTGPISRKRWLCLIAPGLGFGPLMVVGTHYALTGSWSAAAAVASLVPFFLVSNLLLLNQFPDVAADRTVGRDNLPIALGLGPSLRVFDLFAAGAFVAVGAGVAMGLFPPLALLGLMPLPLAVTVHRRMATTIAEGGGTAAMIPALGMNVALTLATPLLLAGGVLAGT